MILKPLSIQRIGYGNDVAFVNFLPFLGYFFLTLILTQDH